MIRRTVSQMNQPKWSHSEIFIDRKSKFQGHCIKIASQEEVPTLIQQLIDNDKSIQRSSHQAMYAWRIGHQEKQQVTNQGMDDCGESGAGMRLMGLLERSGLMNVLVVVTRWYGGTPLGSARFRHISGVAVEALRRGGILEPQKKKK